MVPQFRHHRPAAGVQCDGGGLRRAGPVSPPPHSPPHYPHHPHQKQLPEAQGHPGCPGAGASAGAEAPQARGPQRISGGGVRGLGPSPPPPPAKHHQVLLSGLTELLPTLACHVGQETWTYTRVCTHAHTRSYTHMQSHTCTHGHPHPVLSLLSSPESHPPACLPPGPGHGRPPAPCPLHSCDAGWVWGHTGGGERQVCPPLQGPWDRRFGHSLSLAVAAVSQASPGMVLWDTGGLRGDQAPAGTVPASLDQGTRRALRAPQALRPMAAVASVLGGRSSCPRRASCHTDDSALALRPCRGH